MTNIRQIAKLSGYSVSSVSRVLNNHPHVSQEAREKILAVIEQQDYVPNMVAQELSAGRTKKVGVVMPHNRHPYFTQMLNGMMDAAQKTDYRLVLLPSQYDEYKEKEYLEQLRRGALDHLVFTSRSLSLDTLVSYTKYGHILACEKVTQPEIRSVYVDRQPACQQAMTWLQEQGISEKIALVFTRAEEKSATYRQTMAAYRAVFNQASMPIIYDGVANEGDGRRIAEDMLKHPVTAILANSDEVAAGIYQVFQESDQSMPILIGQENLLPSRLLGLPTIETQSYQLGRLALEMVLAETAQPQALEVSFIER